MNSPLPSAVKITVRTGQCRRDAMSKTYSFIITGFMKTVLMLYNCSAWMFGILVLCTATLGLFDDGGVRPDFLFWAFVGALVALLSMCGCCCIAKRQPALLYMYGAFLAVLVLMELGIGATVYVYRTNLMQRFEHDLNKTFSAYGQKDVTLYIDIAQYSFSCCGIKGPSDWLIMYPPREVPVSCCKNYQIPSGESQGKQGPPVCDVHDPNQIYPDGCYTLYSAAIGVSIGIAFFTFVSVFLACCLASKFNKTNQSSLTKGEQVA